MLEVGLKAVKPLYPKNDADRARDEKYRSFRRNDLHRIHRPILYLFAPFMLVRWIVGICAWAFLSLMTKLILIGHKRDKPILGLRRTLLIFNLKLCAKINLVMVGCLFINIQDTYYDYSEYDYDYDDDDDDYYYDYDGDGDDDHHHCHLLLLVFDSELEL